MLIPFLTLSSTVTFAAPTDTLARLLPKLGAAMGQRLVADRTAGQQVLLVRVRNMDRERLLTLVADVTGGIWEGTEGGGRRLTLGPRRIRELREKDAKGREAWIAEARKAVKGALGGALSTVDDAALARLAPGKRIVWSSRPNSFQRALRIGNRWGNALVAERRHESDVRDDPSIEAPQGPVETTLFAVRRGLGSIPIGIGLSAYNADGLRLRQESFLLKSPRRPLDLPPALARKPVEAPAEVQKWDEARREDAEPTLARTFLVRRFHPERFEPLGFTCGPWLDACAKTLGTDVVANLPDTTFLSGPGQTSELSERLNGGFVRGGMEFRVQSGTLIGRPVDLPLSIARRADRSEIRKRFEGLETHGHVPLAFPFLGEFASWTVRSLPFFAATGENPDEGRWAAQAWASLTPDQRTAAVEKGISVPAASPFWSFIRARLERPESENEEIEGRWIVGEPTVFFDGVGRGNAVYARFETERALIYRAPGQFLPAAHSSLWGLAPFFAPAGGLRTATLWPATYQRVRGIVRVGSATMALNFSETLRDGARSYRYPNLFPALRAALDAPWPAP